jgi:hypoxanthine phosphoribosyltransferase
MRRRAPALALDDDHPGALTARPPEGPVTSPARIRSLPEYELDVPMKSILIPADELSEKVAELGRQISDTYRGSVPLLISILKGGVVFLTDLMRAISIPHHIDFLQVSSYAGGTKSTGTVRIMSDLGSNIAGRDVLVVEDIIDTGLTLTYLLKQLEIRQPRSLRVCALLSKTEARQVDVPIDFLGFEIPNEFVVGYGLDYDEKYRNLPYIGVLDL